MTQALLHTHCPDLELLARGKVRDLYRVDDNHLLFVATDRISAFDVIMSNGVPGKGKILTQLSTFWFQLLRGMEAVPVGDHLVTSSIDSMPSIVHKYRDQLEGRSLLVRKYPILPVEAVVRGYITGSGWKEYVKKGSVCDIPLPAGLKECSRLPEALFTPSTKAAVGDKDENIHPDKVSALIGQSHALAMERAALAVYEAASAYALERGIIIADTKFEFGVDGDGLVLVDEVLTPDSSRFWPCAGYQEGRGQDSYDKQFVRDYLIKAGLDGVAGVELPQTVIEGTLAKYVEIFTILTGAPPIV